MKTIEVTATFTVRFPWDVNDEQFKQLEAGKARLEDLVDDSHAYHLLSSEGDVDWDWDFHEPKPKKGKRKRKAKAR